MLFVAIIIILMIAYVVQMRIYKKHTFNNFSYRANLDSTEVAVGDDIYMYEELSNEKTLPLPYIKVATILPEGLAFRLAVTEVKKNKNPKIPPESVFTTKFAGSIESMFVMKGRQRIKRRWRVSCKKRGVYTLGNAVIISNDLIGFNPISQRFTVEPSKSTTITVLPQAVDLDRDFTSTRYYSGEIVTNRSLLTDPMLRSGAREYTPIDPMSKINWKLTASHGKMMVNIEDYVQKVQSNIILNMCSQIIERSEEIPENPEFIEYNITVAASLLERFANENVPVRFIANTPPQTIHEDFAASDSETGKKILITPPFVGKYGTLDAMRILASLEMKYSLPIEKMLDFILENPYYFAENGNIVFVTAVIDGRMLLFHREMMKLGIEVIFYVTTTNRGITNIPNDIKIFYRTYFDSYKAEV